MKIEIANLHRHYRVNARMAERIARGALGRLKRPLPEALDIAFVCDRSMRKFNRIYKRHDRFTDVLSFRIEAREFRFKSFVGQIIISVDMARANAAVFGVSPARELALYIVHGILHLAGYDDARPALCARMRGAEDRIMGYLCVKEDLSRVLTRR